MRRILSLFLILSLGFPPPACALRALEVTEAGTEETVARSLRSHPLHNLLTELEQGQIAGRQFFGLLVKTIGEGDPITLEAALFGFSRFVGDPAILKPTSRESRLLGMRIAHHLARAKPAGVGSAAPFLDPGKEEEVKGKGKRGLSDFSIREVDQRYKVDFNEVRRRMERMKKTQREDLTGEEVQIFLKAYRAENITEEQWKQLSGFLKEKRFNGKKISPDFFDRHVIKGKRIGSFTGVREAMKAFRSLRWLEGREKQLTARENRSFFEALAAEDIRPDDWAELHSFLTEYNLPLAFAYLKRKGYTKKYPKSTVDDLFQILIGEGLRSAIRKFKPEKGFQFSTYANGWFRHAAREGLSVLTSQRHIPQYEYQAKSQYEKAEAAIMQEKGRPARPEEVAKELGWRKAGLRNLMEAFRLEISISGKDPNDEPGLDVLASSDIVQPDLDWVLAALDRLDPPKRLILKMRFGIGKPAGEGPSTLKEIGEKMGVPRIRTGQLEKEALGELREMERAGGVNLDVPPNDHADVFVLSEMGVPFATPFFQPLLRLGRKNLERIWTALSAAGMEEKPRILSSAEAWGRDFLPSLDSRVSPSEGPLPGYLRPISMEVVHRALERLPPFLGRGLVEGIPIALTYQRLILPVSEFMLAGTPVKQFPGLAAFSVWKVGDGQSGRDYWSSWIQLYDIPAALGFDQIKLKERSLLPSLQLKEVQRAYSYISRGLVRDFEAYETQKEKEIRRRLPDLPDETFLQSVILQEVGGILWMGAVPASFQKEWSRIYPFDKNPDKGPIFLRNRLAAFALEPGEMTAPDRIFAEETFSNKFAMFVLGPSQPIFAEMGWAVRPEEQAYFERLMAHLEGKVRSGLKLNQMDVPPAAGVEELRVPVLDIEGILKTLTEEERQRLSEAGGEILAVRVDPDARLEPGARFFDQVKIPLGTIAGAARIPLGTTAGETVVTFVESSLTEQDVVFFSSRWVVPGEVRSWLPEKIFPRVVVGEEDQLRSQSEPVLAAFAQLAEQERRQGRALVAQYVTLATYQGQQFLLVAA